MSVPPSSTKLLEFYHQRALGKTLPAPTAPHRLTIVHAHAEAVKSTEALRKLVGQEPGDGGRKT
jgi:hypothetical protein